MAFLGHIIFSEGIEVDQRKIETVNNWPRILTPTDYWSFLGLACYYKRFVNDFVPLHLP